MTATLTNPGTPTMREVARHALLRHLEQTPVGTKLPTLDELSRDFSIGRNNLQEAMRELAQEGWVVSRPRLGTFVVRQRSGSVSSKRKGVRGRVSTTRNIATSGSSILAGKRVTMLTYDFTEPMTQTMAMAAEAKLVAAGAQIIKQPFEGGVAGLSLPRGTDLCLFISPSMSVLTQWQHATPMVAASTVWHGGCTAVGAYDLVGVDQVRGATLAGGALRQAGFTSACFLEVARGEDFGKQESTSAIRLRGFEAGFGKTVAPEHRIDGGGFSLKGGSVCFMKYMAMNKRPKAIFAASDELAVGFIVAAQAQNMHAGRDFHIIGFDGQRQGRMLQDGPLTTIDIPLQAMGQQAAALVIDRLVHPENLSQVTYLGCQLFKGVTVAQP